MQAFGVPASWRTLLLLPKQLNYVNLAVLIYEALDQIVKPCNRQLPPVVPSVPDGLMPVAAPQEFVVLSRIGKPD